MEVASVRRPPRRRRSRRRRSRAWVALAAYAACAVAAAVLISRSLDDPAPGSPTATESTPRTGGLSEDPDELALQTLGSRAQRSTVGVGESTGFVAWRSNGLTLVLTSRPAGGWSSGSDRALPVRYGERTFGGVLVRADPATGLGLVRVRNGGVAEPLWQRSGTATVASGDRVVLVGRESARTAEVERAGERRLYFAGRGFAAFAGSPVLDSTGQVVAVVDAGGGGIPVDRACGPIRRC